MKRWKGFPETLVDSPTGGVCCSGSANCAVTGWLHIINACCNCQDSHEDFSEFTDSKSYSQFCSAKSLS